jgi:hypothetical protein
VRQHHQRVERHRLGFAIVPRKLWFPGQSWGYTCEGCAPCWLLVSWSFCSEPARRPRPPGGRASPATPGPARRGSSASGICASAPARATCASLVTRTGPATTGSPASAGSAWPRTPGGCSRSVTRTGAATPGSFASRSGAWSRGRAGRTSPATRTTPATTVWTAWQGPACARAVAAPRGKEDSPRAERAGAPVEARAEQRPEVPEGATSVEQAVLAEREAPVGRAALAGRQPAPRRITCATGSAWGTRPRRAAGSRPPARLVHLRQTVRRPAIPRDSAIFCATRGTNHPAMAASLRGAVGRAGLLAPGAAVAPGAAGEAPARPARAPARRSRSIRPAPRSASTRDVSSATSRPRSPALALASLLGSGAGAYSFWACRIFFAVPCVAGRAGRRW